MTTTAPAATAARRLQRRRCRALATGGPVAVPVAVPFPRPVPAPVQLPFVAGRNEIDVAATDPVSSALPSAVAHSPTATSEAAALLSAR